MTMNTIALPDSTTHDAARRSTTYRWLRPDVTPWEDGATRAVELFVHHDKERKEYHASLSLIDVHAGFVTTRIARGHWLQIQRASVVRYSAKNLDAFAHEALLMLADARAGDERVATLFAGSPF